MTGREARAVVEQTLEALRLEPVAGMDVAKLAHGQRQWVEIASVLAQQPRLVLLDEPAAGMSRDEVRRTAELILELNKDRALVVVEHDMEFISMIASKVTVFDKGRVLMEGRCADVLRDARVRDIYLGKGTPV